MNQKIFGEKDAAIASTLSALGFGLYKDRVYEAAVPLLEREIKIRKEVLGNDHRDTAYSLTYLGLSHAAKKEFTSGRQCLEQALAIRQKVLGEEDPFTIESLNNLGSVSQDEHRYEDARKYYEQALNIRRKSLGVEHLDTAKSLASLGFVLTIQGRYAEARNHFEEALKIRRKLLGEDNAVIATSLLNAAAVTRRVSDYTAARQYLEEATNIRTKIFGNEHVATADTLREMGRLLKDQGDYLGARPYFEQALSIHRKLAAEDNNTATSFGELGALLQDLGDYGTARHYFKLALELKRKIRGDDDPDTSSIHGSLGSLLCNLGEYSAARTHYDEALRINYKLFGEAHPWTANSYGSLGALLATEGDLPKAQVYFEKALAIQRNVLGEGHPDTAVTLTNLGYVLEQRHDYTTAHKYLEQSLILKRTTLGEDHPELATSLTNVGSLCEREGNLAAAKKHYEEALRLRLRTLGAEHAFTAASYSCIGALSKRQGDLISAKENYEKALLIWRKTVGNEHPNTLRALDSLASLEAAIEEWPAATDFLEESRRGARRHIATLLPALSSKEQLIYLRQNDRTSFQLSLSLGLTGASDARIAAMSAGWLINGKGVAQVALAEQSLLARDAKDASVSATVRQLHTVRQRLATISMVLPKPGEEAAHRENLQQLTTDEQRLARLVAHRTVRNADSEPWAELATVRQNLPTGSAFIDIARFPVYNFQAKGQEPQWQPAHYVAWITTPGERGTTEIVDLGPAEPIEEAVKAARKLLEDSGGLDGIILRDGEVAAEKDLRKAFANVASLVWDPLAVKLNGTKQLIICPDGLLWHLPWDALPLGATKYLIEDYSLRYVLSGRDLIPVVPSAGQVGQPIAIANPAYDLSPQRTRMALEEVFPSLKQRGIPDAALREQSILSRAMPLPLTADEAKAVAPSLQRYAGAEVSLFMGQHALEDVIKNVKQPSVVFLSTHGFFLDDDEIRPEDDSDPIGDKSTLSVNRRTFQNPLLRCGLLFAGCNSAQAENIDDGVLTGMEILGIDLRGTKLVVLSACETGVGQVRNGEGVAGLRQAFQLAGAETVVASLWSVPVIDTAELMTDFFEILAKGQTKADALRFAQLKRMAAHRRRSGAAHPWFWAAFTVTGR